MNVRPVYIIIGFLLILIGIELFYITIPLSFERRAVVMGTTVRIRVTGLGAPYLTARAISEIKRLDGLFSKYVKNSEIGLINQMAGKAPLQVSSDTFQVVKMAVEINKISKGAFDITLGHARDLDLDKKTRKVFLKNSWAKIDLGGIGKGYAVESARKLLLKKGIKSAIIDMHSSIGVLDPRNPAGTSVGTQKSETDERKILGTLILNDGDALSTSAQYEQPGHIIDPRTGKVANQCLGVTVVAKDAGFADALSTAIFVLGPIEGMKLAKKLGVKVVIVDKKGKITGNLMMR